MNDRGGFFPIPAEVKGIGHGTSFNAERWLEIAAKRNADSLIAGTWIEQAVAEGWTTTRIDPRDDASLRLVRVTPRGEFRGHGVARLSAAQAGPAGGLGHGDISLWGPDGLNIKVPLIYPGIDWIVAGLRRCWTCGDMDTDTIRYSFAGRCCPVCLPAMQAEHEKPGWCD